MRNNPPLPNLNFPVIRFVIQYFGFGNIFENVFDYLSDAPVGINAALLNGFITNWIGANEAPLRNLMSQDTRIDSYTAIDLTPGTTPTVEQVQTGKTGLVLQPSLPPTNAVVVTKGTSTKGQHGRGRLYGPPLPITFVTPATDPDSLNNVGANLYALWMNALLVPFAVGGSNWSFGITTRPVPPATIPTKGQVVSFYFLRNILGTVRRRREGRGI